MRVLFIIIAILFSACGIYEENLKPDIINDKKILSSRKSQIIIDSNVKVVCVATYLNTVLPSTYSGREYFLLEIFSQDEDISLDLMEFKITDNKQLLWAREVDSSEFDNVINVNNKWSKAFILAFSEVDEVDKKNIKLEVDISNLGVMQFDFTYKVFEMQF